MRKVRMSNWIKGNKKLTLVSYKRGNKTTWKIVGWNPLPAKGEFESSYSALKDWLDSNGWMILLNHPVYLMIVD